MPSSVNILGPQDVAEETVGGGMPTAAQNQALWKQKLGPALSNGWVEKTGKYRRQCKEIGLSEDNGFKYTPLPLPSCIRLLTLEPGKPADVIRCSLRTVDLADKPSYTALSYAWEQGTSRGESWSYGATDLLKRILHLAQNKTHQAGAQDVKKDYTEIANGVRKKIVCNGQTMKVFPNLYDALLELRLNRPGDYWIDAICMNQLDNDERTAQVAIMGHIYHAAESVTVWLGTCPALLTMSMDTAISRAKLVISQPSAEGDIDLEEHPFGIVGVLYLLTRTWFKRIWTVQEVCFARQLTFRMGKHEIDPDVLVYFTSQGAIEEYEIWTDPPHKWKTHLRNIISVLESRQFFKEGGKWSLEQWLRAVKGRKVKQARDLIYGGLSLIDPNLLRIDHNLQLSLPSTAERASTEGFKRQPLWSIIAADYDVETPQVFLNVAACLLSQPNGLVTLFSILPMFCDNGLERDHPDFVQQDRALEQRMPSWVPNPKFWSSPAYEPISSAEYGFAACSQLLNNPKISTDGNTLHLDVIRLDEIDSVWPIKNWMAIFRVLMRLRDIRRHCSPVTESSDSLLGTYARVIVAGRLSEPDALVGMCNLMHTTARGDVANFNRGQKALLPRLNQEELDPDSPRDETLSGHSAAVRLEAIWTKFKATFPEAPWPSRGSEPLEKDDLLLGRQFETLCDTMMTSRRIFITKGGYLGMGNKWYIQPGDQVVLVKGLDVPHIIRRVDDDLRRRADEIRDLMKELKKERKTNKVGPRDEMLSAELTRIRSQIGDLDGWVLGGEAYVEGVMHGEAVHEGSQFERLEVV